MPSVLVAPLLLVGIFVVSLVRKGVASLVNKSGLKATLAESDNGVDLGANLASLSYYIVLLMVFSLVLERMGITAVLDPLKNLVDQFAAHCQIS